MLALLFTTATAAAAPEMIPLDEYDAARHALAASVDFTLPLRDGGTFTMSSHGGEKVLLSFWASWCSPCRRELPALALFAAEHPELTVLAVNVDRERADAERFLDQVEVKLPVAFDPDARALGRYGVTSMPTMFLFDRSGALEYRHSGYSDENGFSELIAALQGGK